MKATYCLGGDLEAFGPRGGVLGAGRIDGGSGGGDLPVERSYAPLAIRLGGLDCRGAGGKGRAFMRRTTGATVVDSTTGPSAVGVAGSAAPEATLA